MTEGAPEAPKPTPEDERFNELKALAEEKYARYEDQSEIFERLADFLDFLMKEKGYTQTQIYQTRLYALLSGSSGMSAEYLKDLDLPKGELEDFLRNKL